MRQFDERPGTLIARFAGRQAEVENLAGRKQRRGRGILRQVVPGEASGDLVYATLGKTLGLRCPDHRVPGFLHQQLLGTGNQVFWFNGHRSGAAVTG